MKFAALFRLSLVLLAVCAAGFVSAKTDAAPGGPTPELFKREARFSRLYNPAIKPDREAVPVMLAPLVYPPKWKQWGQPAYAVMVFLVDATGRPVEIQCTEATDRAFAKAATKAIENSRFIPALKNQQGVSSKFEHRVEFTLRAPGADAAAPATSDTPAASVAPGQP